MSIKAQIHHAKTTGILFLLIAFMTDPLARSVTLPQTIGNNSSPLTVAVLIFRNTTSDAETAALGDGIADSLTNGLKSVASLSVTDAEIVAEAASQLQLSGNTLRDTDALTIGQRLGVRMIVTGSYQRFGNQIRVDARILNVALNRAQPGQAISVTVPYPAGYSDLLNQLTDKVAKGLQVQVSPTEMENAKENLAGSRSPQAQQAYNNGIQALRQRAPDDLRRAIQFFGQALTQDPNFSAAYAAKADAESRLLALNKANGISDPALARDAVNDATKSITTSPKAGRGYVSLARAYSAMGRYDEAGAAARRGSGHWPGDVSSLLEISRANGRGTLIRDAALDRALLLQNGLSLIMREMTQVVVSNKSEYELTVQFIPESGSTYPTVRVAPNASNVVSLLPGKFRVVAQSQAGPLNEDHLFEAGKKYELTYSAEQVQRANAATVAETAGFRFDNSGNVAVTVFLSGPVSRTIVVAPGKSEEVRVPPGQYTVTASATGVAPSSRTVQAESGRIDIIRYQIITSYATTPAKKTRKP